ncbi:CBS domain-containing protein [Desulfohalotomaculum tongense]|uniref:CBS domain-containing protein n=1 Tax=Desulforadius tongensis TaxID=1216062 RepID=UPI00195A11CA|nr:CBS domain-containing protein [Desulforadius tongensis]MBM7856153.1 CBS domain-containing protein [Desulforadius tongensis]
MPRKLLVRDVMIPIDDYLTVCEEDSIHTAIRTLRTSIFHNDSGSSYGHQTLLVLNNEGDFTGILTLHDLLKAVELKDHYNDPWLKSASWSWFFINRIHQAEGVKVKEIMRPIFLVTVNAHQTIQDAVKKMFSQDENFIPVLENDVPVGIIRTIDLFWVIDELL